VIAKAKGYGVTSLEGGSPVTPETLFQAGSVSKPVTALGALRLVDQQKLTLDADVNDVLHTWHLPGNDLTAGNPVTLRRLLSHTAGLTVHGFPGYRADGPLPTLVQVLDGQPPANTKPIRVDLAPGSKWRYSGGGYIVVQQMMMDVSGRPFADFMWENVLEPLGMNASTFEQPLPAKYTALTATGHLPAGRPVPGRWHVYPEMAAAGLWTTPSDLARFAIALQKSFTGDTHPVLSPATARLMVTPEKGSYGLGFQISGRGPTEQFAHNGRDEGFDAILRAYRTTGLGAVVMININDDSSFQTRVLDAIAKEYHWPDYVPYESPQAIADREPAVKEQVKTIFLAAQAGQFDKVIFMPELAEVLAVAIPGGTAKAMQKFGVLKSITPLGRRDEGANRTYRFHLECENETVLAVCTYRSDGKISRIFFRPE
jgi:CubicO group peptidase (beta-lactamase class C family)